MTTNACKFKVGETYKNRKGRSYRIIAVVPDAAPEYRVVALELDNKYITTRHDDGRLARYAEAPADLLPNKRKEWVVTYDYFDSRAGLWRDGYKVLSDASSADALVAIMKSKPEVYKHVRGPLLWEYEE